MNIIAKQSNKFVDPDVTADGKARAHVTLQALKTLWLNTGTQCNLTCENCYIESSPKNDRLVYLTRDEVAGYLDEIRDLALPVEEVGITGGEPFMNPDICAILQDCLSAGHRVIVLTNAMRPMMKCTDGLIDLNERFPGELTLRVSIDHHDRHLHEQERGKRSWAPMVKGLQWLSANGFQLHVAGRTLWGDTDHDLRIGYAELFEDLGISIDANDPAEFVVFPEMDGSHEVPEITTECWDILGVDPQSPMCANSRMIVKRKGAPSPEVVACTLLPYEPEFAYGSTLAESFRPIALNHPHCARFCVLGGGSCSG
jgi:uncharacterized Fe-S cluster-containing radical SAM superfamily protein